MGGGFRWFGQCLKKNVFFRWPLPLSSAILSSAKLSGAILSYNRTHKAWGVVGELNQNSNTKLLPNQDVTEEVFPCFGFLRSIVFQVWGKCRLSLFIAFGFHFEDGNGRQSHQALALTWRDKIEITIWPFSYFESRTRLHIVILVFRDEIETLENLFSWSSEKKWSWLSSRIPGIENSCWPPSLHGKCHLKIPFCFFGTFP